MGAAEMLKAGTLYKPERKGAALPPIVVDRVAHTEELLVEETFGPVIPIILVPYDAAATMAISNSTAFGLSSGGYTNHLDRMAGFDNFI